MTELDALGSPEKAIQLARFFKTGSGQYGEGDRFMGVRVPEQRRVANGYGALPLEEIALLLASPIHEHRMTGLLILVARFAKNPEEAARREVVAFYLTHLERVNSWDLVDLSAPKILGKHLLQHPSEREMLYHMARSNHLWTRRVAVVATWPMIKQGQFNAFLILAERLLSDPHDLMHKAVGWMLREVGKVNLAVLEGFLGQYADTMPRTMLRYAIERLTAPKKKIFLGAAAALISSKHGNCHREKS